MEQIYCWGHFCDFKGVSEYSTAFSAATTTDPRPTTVRKRICFPLEVSNTRK
jgi:hypothetical protein